MISVACLLTPLNHLHSRLLSSCDCILHQSSISHIFLVNLQVSLSLNFASVLDMRVFVGLI